MKYDEKHFTGGAEPLQKSMEFSEARKQANKQTGNKRGESVLKFWLLCGARGDNSHR